MAPLREYILQQVSQLRQELSSLESKYGMSFDQFAAYVHERSVLLEEGDLSPEQRKALGQAIMQEKKIGWTGRSIGRCWRAGWGFARRLSLDVDCAPDHAPALTNEYKGTSTMPGLIRASSSAEQNQTQCSTHQ